MLVSDFRPQLIDSLSMLTEFFCLEAIPESVLNKTLSANPWFTEYYIDKSLRAIRTWLDSDQIWAFVEKYPKPLQTPIQVGIIAAGNLPLVGFHDVLMTLLSGNIAQVKCSHQDWVLLEWMREIWIKRVPLLSKVFHLVSQLEKPDFLIATGNNNSARYFHSAYEKIPRIVRKNRFSVAVLDQEVNEKDLALLCEDMLLYNGLGCRNVSNLIIWEGFEIKRLVNQLDTYKQNLMNPLYLERVLYEKSRAKVLELPVILSQNLLLFFSDFLDYSTMGTVRFVQVQNQEEEEAILRSASQKIQCIVGRDTKFGQTQYPPLDAFADGIDTMNILMDEKQRGSIVL